MTQEKRRSISYRSFVTCDNPKDVECGAIRKSKQHSNKVESENKRQENQTPSLTIIKEDKKQMGITGFTREFVDTSLSDHLDPVTNSYWSNKGHKEDIAKDLLKGVLDLQESLVILSKLQETSSYKSKRKQKLKQKLEEVIGSDDMGNGLMDSNRFGYLHDEKKLHMGFQGPRVSVDGSSRKSVDEVRSAVRESLLRQNMMKNPTFEHFQHRMVHSPALPSTSSSYFSLFDSAISSTASHRRKKGQTSNLIVKLMGLESFPSSPRNYKERERVPNLTKPMYDSESPRARKSKFAAQELGTKQRAFDEVLESLNFKGLLRSNSAEGVTPSSWNFEDCYWVDERPPIVVMRPLRLLGDGDLVNGGNIEKPSSRRGSPQQTVRNYYEAANSRDKFREVTARSKRWKENRISPKKAAYGEEKVYANRHERQQKKADVRRISEDETVAYIRRKGEGKKNTECFDELSSWDLSKLTKAKMPEQKYGDFFSKNQNSYRDNIFSTALLDYRNVKTSQRHNHWKKNRQPVSMVEIQRCKGERKENKASAREEIDSSSENGCDFPTFDSMLISNRNIERWKRCSRAMISDYDAESQSSDSQTLEGIEYLNYDHWDCCDTTQKGHLDDNQSLLSEITSTFISEHCGSVGGHLNENRSPVSEITSVTTHEIGIAVHDPDTDVEGDADHPQRCRPYEGFIEGDTDCETLTQCLTPRAKMKAFLLNSSLFVNRAEELFNLQVNPRSIPHVTDESDLGVANPQVLLDCVIELMELRSTELKQVCVLPFLTTYPRNSTSMCQLLEEICRGVEDLGCYLNLDGDSFSSDNLHAVLDQDLRLRSGMWGIGWRNMFSLDELEQIVGEVDEFVLGKLIEDVLAEFLQ